MIWQIIGFLIIGAIGGYALVKHRWLYILLIFLVGLGLVMTSEPPNFKMDGSWWNTAAMSIGVIYGTLKATLEEERASG